MREGMCRTQNIFALIKKYIYYLRKCVWLTHTCVPKQWRLICFYNYFIMPAIYQNNKNIYK